MIKSNITYSNYREATLTEFYEDFLNIWERDFEERSLFDLWLHTVDHASRIARAVRQENPPVIIDDIADTTVWLMSFIAFCESSNNSLNDNLLEEPSLILWKRYPGVCPSCFDSFIYEEFKLGEGKTSFEDFNLILNQIDLDKIYMKPCDCITRISNHVRKKEIITSYRTELDLLRIEYAKLLFEQGMHKSKVIDFEMMFEKIYSNSYHLMSLEDILFNLQEEIGETTQAILNLYTFDESREPFSKDLYIKRKRRLSQEVGDIFSWLFAATIKIKMTYGRIAHLYNATITKDTKTRTNLYDLSFTDIIWSKYGMTADGANWETLKCPGCQSNPCDCQRDLKINWKKANNGIKQDEIININKLPEKMNDLIFISYSHKDQKWLSSLKEMLKPLMREKKLSTWDDTRIVAGKLWREEIDSALSRSKAAILLVTPSFLASDFIAENELPPLLDRAKKNGTKIFWLPISSSMYHTTELKDYQALSDPSKPLDTMVKANRNKVLVEICNTIYEETK